MKKFVFVLFLILFAVVPKANAETPPLLYDADLQFVDAVGGTGYYVDMNSIDIKGHAADALVVIVDADENKLYLYRASFQLKTRQCTIKDAFLYRYEDKKELKSLSQQIGPIAYAADSPLENIALYIINPKP